MYVLLKEFSDCYLSTPIAPCSGLIQMAMAMAARWVHSRENSRTVILLTLFCSLPPTSFHAVELGFLFVHTFKYPIMDIVHPFEVHPLEDKPVPMSLLEFNNTFIDLDSQ